MSATKDRRPLAEMRASAELLVSLWRASCQRIEIAGSIRRGKPDVGEIEIVAIQRRYELTARLDAWLAAGTCEVRVNKRGNRLAWGDKYRALTWQGIPVDLFLTTPDQWGLILLIRTGPGSVELGFERWPGGANQYLVTQCDRGGALPDDLRVADGRLWRGDRVIPTPEENDFFQVVGLPYVEPDKRSMTEYKRLLTLGQNGARSASQGPAVQTATPREPFSRDYWLAGQTREALRALAGRLVHDASIDRSRSEWIEYQGQDRRWHGCLTVRAADHGAIRDVYFKLLSGGNHVL